MTRGKVLILLLLVASVSCGNFQPLVDFFDFASNTKPRPPNPPTPTPPTPPTPPKPPTPPNPPGRWCVKKHDVSLKYRDQCPGDWYTFRDDNGMRVKCCISEKDLTPSMIQQMKEHPETFWREA